MDTPLATFEPAAGGMQSLSIAAFIVFLACSIGTVFLLRQKAGGHARGNNALMAMLLFFVGIISLGTFVFNTLAYQRVGTVIVFEDGIELGKHKIVFSDIENATIESTGQTSFINPDILKKTTQILLIYERNGKTHALSSEHYAVEEIMETMRAALIKWEQQQN